ncbi:hypothetical protein Y032_0025g1132 [Ancylostoma ceylanicum]|uniref:Uncharacterized protein n=1 Tax=Ancylostoma ceylanicum TaxID=53326 RepID=A0A016UX69_9BILA|nr:hypothetical protein Y032_0025g1132 [Ancylostoma ceylanicum]
MGEILKKTEDVNTRARLFNTSVLLALLYEGGLKRFRNDNETSTQKFVFLPIPIGAQRTWSDLFQAILSLPIITSSEVHKITVYN